MALHQTKLLLLPSLLLLTLLPVAEAVPDSVSAAFGVAVSPPPSASRRHTSRRDHNVATQLPLSSSSPNVASVASEEAPELLRCEDGDSDPCQTLCNERNLPLEQVKNARDLASVRNSPVIPGRIFRTGRLGDATLQDRGILFGISDDTDKNENTAVECGIRTLVDLRSPTELKDDPALNNPDVFEDFLDFVWRERDNSVHQLAPGEAVVKPRRKKRSWSPSRKDSSITYDSSASSSSRPPPSHTAEDVGPRRKERHFVSLMNEFKYVKGTVPRVAKRHLLKSALTSPGALVSRRARTSVKKPFLKIINKGGLSLLNELVLQHGAPGICRVLDLCSDPQRHPIAFYCTAGKDRTGIIAAIILGLCGATPDDIVEDYTLSANVYAEMNDHKAMVGALSQRALDPSTFLCAPASVMRDTLALIDRNYGSVEEYCTQVLGFGPEDQERLICACTRGSPGKNDATTTLPPRVQTEGEVIVESLASGCDQNDASATTISVDNAEEEGVASME